MLDEEATVLVPVVPLVMFCPICRALVSVDQNPPLDELLEDPELEPLEPVLVDPPEELVGVDDEPAVYPASAWTVEDAALQTGNVLHWYPGPPLIRALGSLASSLASDAAAI
jgi:hypothetical protein